jgi:DNA-binding response OmpR family regulator
MKGSSRKVLVLDPSDAYGPMLEQLEQRQGLKVERAGGAAGAMKKLATRRYDGVIVDADAPVARSRGFLSALRSCAPAVRILLLVSRRIEELEWQNDEEVYYCLVRHQRP